MKRSVIFLAVITVLALGCSRSSQPEADQQNVSRSELSPIPEAARQALDQIYVGMPESNALAILKPVSIDFGESWAGSAGWHLDFFQFSPHHQVCITIGNNFAVQEIGRVEPKGPWKRDQRNNVITKNGPTSPSTATE